MRDQEDLTPFGQKLTAILLAKGVSDSELAKRLGIAQPNIHTLKYKTRIPRNKTVSQIAKALRVKPEALRAPEMQIESGARVLLVVEKNGKKTTVRLA